MRFVLSLLCLLLFTHISHAYPERGTCQPSDKAFEQLKQAQFQVVMTLSSETDENPKERGLASIWTAPNGEWLLLVMTEKQSVCVADFGSKYSQFNIQKELEQPELK